MSFKKTGYWSAGLWRDKKDAWKEIFPGVHRRVLSNSQTATLIQFRFDPGCVVAKHNHPHAQFGVCLEGGGELTVGEKIWKVSQGDSWFIPPGMTHDYRNHSKKPSMVIECFTPQREEYGPDVSVE